MRTGLSWIAVILLNLVLAGCGGDRPMVLTEGCYSGDRIPAGVWDSLQTSIDAYYARVRAGRWEEIYANVATSVQEQRTPQEFLTPLVGFVQQFGLPDDLKHVSTTVVRFGSSFPHTIPLECATGENSPPFNLLLLDYPTQASVVHLGDLGKDSFYISSLWYLENEVWKMAGFFSKPATMIGKGWEEYAEWAAAERLANNRRNAALLYNIAIDLVLPNAWTQPAELNGLKRRQGRLNVTQLPVGTPEPWPAETDTFSVFSTAYALIADELGILFGYETLAPLSDSTAVGAYSDQLSRYIRAGFPEYEEVFDKLVLRAVNPEDREQYTTHIYSLRSTP